MNRVLNPSKPRVPLPRQKREHLPLHPKNLSSHLTTNSTNLSTTRNLKPPPTHRLPLLLRNLNHCGPCNERESPYRRNKRLYFRPPRFREPLCPTLKRGPLQGPRRGRNRRSSDRKLVQALEWRPTKRRNSSRTRFGTWLRGNGSRSIYLPWVLIVGTVGARAAVVLAYTTLE